jgi:hypothetical protein
VVQGGVVGPVDDFEFAYVTADGAEVRRELREAWAVALERGGR